MTNIKEENTSRLIKNTSEKLKPELKIPEWANYIKTGPSKERPPQNQDWWYLRAASILVAVYNKGPIGTSKLKTKYGSKKNRGYKPEKFKRGSGKIIRTILQDLERLNYLEIKKDSVHKGRIITKKGISLLSKK
ncbi:40S ribosomal protein S19 [Candidatus Woesearchaeota archaeon]|nr:40S ribosomal protein S19 [Candidatus Woesearchaeota archaeon]